MGALVEGIWREADLIENAAKGEFVRRDSTVRNWITPDGRSGPSGEAGFEAEPGRYHLYVSHACPWAHRALIMRALKGLETLLSVSCVNPFLGAGGWSFEPGPGGVGDDVNDAKYLHEVYVRSNPRFTGRVTVPVLWDKKRSVIVSNESSEIIRMLNHAFDHLGAREVDYYPSDLRAEIDEVNARIYRDVNNGVYRCGFASTREAYADAFGALFSTLDWLEERLSSRRFLLGRSLTEADVRLFPTLVRFDPVYFGHFKTNRRRLIDYEHLWGYTRDIYQRPGLSETVNMRHIKHHYYGSHRQLNPSGIVPLGPSIDFMADHDRAALG